MQAGGSNALACLQAVLHLKISSFPSFPNKQLPETILRAAAHGLTQQTNDNQFIIFSHYIIQIQ